MKSRFVISLFICLGMLFFNGRVSTASIRADAIIVSKTKRTLVLYSDGQMVKKYDINLGGNPKGSKEFEGDMKTPEGTYYIESKNPNSKYHLALRVSYPNREDVLRAQMMGRKPGGDIMVHGMPNGAGWLKRFSYSFKDWTAGCIAVSNNDIEEIYSMVNEGTPITILP